MEEALPVCPFTCPTPAPFSPKKVSEHSSVCSSFVSYSRLYLGPSGWKGQGFWRQVNRALHVT